MGLYTDRPMLNGYEIMSKGKKTPGSAAVSKARVPCVQLHAKTTVSHMIATEPPCGCLGAL